MVYISILKQHHLCMCVCMFSTYLLLNEWTVSAEIFLLATYESEKGFDIKKNSGSEIQFLRNMENRICALFQKKYMRQKSSNIVFKNTPKDIKLQISVTKLRWKNPLPNLDSGKVASVYIKHSQSTQPLPIPNSGKAARGKR